MGSDESPRRVSLYVYIIICIVMSNFRPHSVCYWLSPLPVIFVNLHITCHSDSLVCPSLAGRSANGRLTNTNWYALFIVILLGFTIHTRCSGLAKESAYVFCFLFSLIFSYYFFLFICLCVCDFFFFFFLIGTAARFSSLSTRDSVDAYGFVGVLRQQQM